MLDRLLGNLRFALGLVGFLRHTTDLATARAGIRAQLPLREESFLDVAERAIYANPQSPYCRLLLHFGVGLTDLTRMVRELGLEAALDRLYNMGVYVTYEELRGRRPIRRGDLEFEVKVSDFDNPLLTAFRAARTSGSRSSGTRVYVDLRMLAEEAGQIACLLDAHGVYGRPLAVWQPQPPASNGLNGMLRFVRMRMSPEAWFSQTPRQLANGGWRGTAYLAYTVLISYLARRPIVWPRHVPPDRAEIVASWLAEKKRRGTPAVLDTSVSGATRVSLAATERRLDIAGTAFRIGGEPLTPAKAQIISAAGGKIVSRYQMVETGIIALGCAKPSELDDMHVVSEKFAVLRRDKDLGGATETVPALVYTSLMPSCRSIMLNAESGDYGDLAERDCGCPLAELGYGLHLSGVRGYDKLTSEGVTFMGTELYRLVDETLPTAFGGHATDYQLVEEEGEDGLPKVSIIVSQRVGAIDESAVIQKVLDELRSYYIVGSQMASIWQGGGTLRVLRREPYTSGGRKIQPLHVRRPSGPERPSTPALPK